MDLEVEYTKSDSDFRRMESLKKEMCRLIMVKKIFEKKKSKYAWAAGGDRYT